MTTPAIREIRMNYPNAFVTLVVRKMTYNIAELCPYVNEVLSFDEVGNYNDVLQNIYFSAVFSKQYLWRRRYDLAFSFRCWDDGWCKLALWLMYMSGARERVAYRHDAYRMYHEGLLPPEQNISYALLTHPVINPREVVHQVSRCLFLIKAYGLRVRQTEMEVWYSNSDLYNAKKLLGNFGEGRVKVCIAVGASTRARTYPIEKYLIAFREIISKGASIIILGGPAEVDDAKFLEENLPAEFVKNVVKFKPNWRTTAALMSMTDIYIGNDTGTQHVAAALKKPVILVSRVAKDRKKFFPDVPTEPEGTQPWQSNSIILQPKHQLDDCKTKFSFSGCSKGFSHCIAQIDPSEIVAAYEKMATFIRDVKQVSCPAIIKNIDQVTPLKNLKD